MLASIATPTSCGITYVFYVHGGFQSIGNAVYDPLVFLAMSYRLVADVVAPENGWCAVRTPAAVGQW